MGFNSGSSSLDNFRMIEITFRFDFHIFFQFWSCIIGWGYILFKTLRVIFKCKLVKLSKLHLLLILKILSHFIAGAGLYSV